MTTMMALMMMMCCECESRGMIFTSHD